MNLDDELDAIMNGDLTCDDQILRDNIECVSRKLKTLTDFVEQVNSKSISEYEKAVLTSGLEIKIEFYLSFLEWCKSNRGLSS